MELLKGKQFSTLLVIFFTVTFVTFPSVTSARLLETEAEVLENALSNKHMQNKAQTVSVSDFSGLEPVTVWTDIGKSASVSCQTQNKEAIQTCLWTRTSSATNKSTHFNITVWGDDGAATDAGTGSGSGSGSASTFITNYNDSDNGNGSISRNLINYTPFNIIGRDMPSGFCGISIRLITENDFGSWKCILATKGKEEQAEVEKTIEVLQWEPPKFKPNIENKEMYSDLKDFKSGSGSGSGSGSSKEENNIRRGFVRNAECCTNEGKPEPSLAFFIGNTSIPQNEIVTTTTLDRHIRKNLTCITWTKTKFTYKINGEKLHCVMDHISFDENKKDSEIHQDSIRLNIEYSPILNGLRENSTRKIYIPTNVTILNVSVTAEGNPFPELSWEFQYSNTRGRVNEKGNATETVTKTEANLSTNFDVTTQNITTDKIESTLSMTTPHKHLVFNDSAVVHVTNKYGSTTIRYVFVLDTDNKTYEGGSKVMSTSKTNTTTGSENPAYLPLILFTIFGVCIFAGIAGYIGLYTRRRRWSLETPTPVFLPKPEQKPGPEPEPEPEPKSKAATAPSDNETHLHTARIVRVGARRLKSSRNRANGEVGTATEVAPVKIIDKVQVNSKGSDDIAVITTVMKDPTVNCSASAGGEVHSRCGSPEPASATIHEDGIL